MTTRHFEQLFKPRSIAVFGASDRAGSVGATVTRNLLEGGFAGPIYPVNVNHDEVAGRRAYRDVASLPEAPDLAVIATPPLTVPGIVAALGERGTKSAVVLTAGLGAPAPGGGTLAQAMLDAARPHLLRIVGPNCVGLLVPGIGINASFAHVGALPGNLAFVSQSGGLTTAVLDYARSRSIGFSHFVSLGDSADVDFGDMLDYLASDAGTRAILLYIEAIRDARKFMSAARAAARNKPVIVVKAGRAAEGARAAASHTGALAGSDVVYDAALRRAGMLRVDTVLQLFDAVETLGRAKPAVGDRLAILTNGGGPGVMATDALIIAGGKLATLTPQTLQQLDSFLPPTWSHGDPVDIIGDAPIGRYEGALATLVDAPEADAVLFMHVPTAVVASAEIARTCAPLAARGRVFACWLGGNGLDDARRVFEAAGIPTYVTPEQAVAGFMQTVNYRRNQEALMQTPPSLPPFLADTRAAREVIEGALAQGRSLLNEPEAKRVLAAYGIPVVRTAVARGVDDAVRIATEIGFPVALKIVSPQITHKSDVGGVALNLSDAAQVRAAVESMVARVRERVPGATIEGFSVQEMVRRPGAFETIVGATLDAAFGPVILFGQGGVAVEVVGDRAVALPPLNMMLAEDLVSRTRIARLLRGYRDRPPADLAALYLALTQVAQLVADLPEVVELDINPLLVDHRGVLALDARVRVVPATSTGVERLAIRPYPGELEERVALRGGAEVVLRPVRPEDEPQHARFLAAIDAQDLQLRFFRVVRAFAHSELARFTQIDYDREMAFIAVARGEAGDEETLGVVRAVTDPEGARAEFAILIRSDLKGQGLGALLMDKLIRYCRSRGVGTLVGDVLAHNDRMLGLARDLGFAVGPTSDPASLQVTLDLHANKETS